MVNLQNIVIFNKEYILGEFDHSIDTYYTDLNYDINNLIDTLDIKYTCLSKLRCEFYNPKYTKLLTKEINNALFVSKELITENFHKSIIGFINNINK